MPNLPTMGTRKGLAPVVWVIIAALLLGGGYLLVQKSKIKTENVEPVAEQAVAPTAQKDAQSYSPIPSDWKTYRNEKYGFEFTYPAIWSYDELPDPGEHLICFNPQPPAGDCQDGLLWILNKDASENEQASNLRRTYARIFPATNTLQSADHVYFFAFKTESRQWLNQILSTFRFTKPAGSDKANKKTLLDTMGWKMFRSPANFVFSYPPVFTLLEPRERLLVSLSSPACDFSISLDSLDTEIGGRAVRGEEWYASIREEEVKVGDSSRAARLVYDRAGKLQVAQVGGYIPGVFITMGTPSTNGLSDACIQQFYTMLSTFVP